MTAATKSPPKVWTTADLLAMPDDGVERWIIDGQLREKPSEFPGATMTVRNRHHCKVMALIATALTVWTRTQSRPRGEVYCGEVGIRFPGSTTTVGVDVVYATADVVAVQSDDNSTLIEGIPTLAVEILSPNDTQAQICEKQRTYIKAGVPVVWLVDVDDQTVTVYRPGMQPVLYNASGRLPEYPPMPGFSPSVAELFD